MTWPPLIKNKLTCWVKAPASVVVVVVAMLMMMIIRTRTELAPIIIFILLFWIILVMVSVVDVEGGDGLTPEVSSFDILLVRSKLILILNCVNQGYWILLKQLTQT